MATNSSTTRRRTDTDTDTTDERRDTTETTDTADVVETAPAISYAGDGNTRGIELDPTTHGSHRRNNPTDI